MPPTQYARTPTLNTVSGRQAQNYYYYTLSANMPTLNANNNNNMPTLNANIYADAVVVVGRKKKNKSD